MRYEGEKTSWILETMIAVAVVILLGCRGVNAEPAGCPAPVAPRVLESVEPPNLGQLKLQLREYRCLRYDADVSAVLAKARTWVEQRASQVVNPALVLDIDETSLSNWEQIYHNDFGYIPAGACDLASKAACGAQDWDLSMQASAIKPTLELFNAAKAKKVAVFFVTGRFDSGLEKTATALNLSKAGYFGWDGLYLRDPEKPRPSVAEYKRDMRIDIEAKGYTIIGNIGDQYSDLALEHAEQTFKVPNPFYFLP